jgi:hypothetical protein
MVNSMSARTVSCNLIAVAVLATTAFIAGCTGTAASTAPSSNNNPTTPSGAQLTASATSVSFGQTAVGSNSSQTVTLTASGSSSVTVQSVKTSGTGFSVVQPQLPASLTAGQTLVLAVDFSPAASGQQTGSLVISSSAPQLTVPLSGTGSTTASTDHSATLSWDNGDSTATSYKVYRSSVSGGPYAPINSSPLSATTYKDSTVTAGATYFYVVTETNSSGVESQFSSEVTATVPSS